MEFARQLTCVDRLLCAMNCATYFTNLSFNLNSPSIYFLLLMPFHKCRNQDSGILSDLSPKSKVLKLLHGTAKPVQISL